MSAHLNLFSFFFYFSIASVEIASHILSFSNCLESTAPLFLVNAFFSVSLFISFDSHFFYHFLCCHSTAAKVKYQTKSWICSSKTHKNHANTTKMENSGETNNDFIRIWWNRNGFISLSKIRQFVLFLVLFACTRVCTQRLTIFHLILFSFRTSHVVECEIVSLHQARYINGIICG